MYDLLFHKSSTPEAVQQLSTNAGGDVEFPPLKRSRLFGFIADTSVTASLTQPDDENN